MKPLHDAGDIHKAEKSYVELVEAGRYTAKDLHALEEVFNQVSCLVAVPVQNTLILFAVDPAGDDDLHSSLFCGLDNRVGLIRFVCQKRLGLQPIEQLGHRLGVVPLARDQHKTQRVAQGVGHGVDFGVEPAARDADNLWAAGLSCSCRRLVRPTAGPIKQHFVQVRLLHAPEKVVEMALAAPIGVALVHHAPCAQSLGQAAPVRAIHSRASKNVLCAPPGRPLQGGINGAIRCHCASVKVWRAAVILAKSDDQTVSISGPQTF